MSTAYRRYTYPRTTIAELQAELAKRPALPFGTIARNFAAKYADWNLDIESLRKVVSRLAQGHEPRIEVADAPTGGSAQNLSEEENAILKAYKEHTALLKECEGQGVPVKDVAHYWLKSEHFSLFVKNRQKSYEEIKDEVVRDMRAYAPQYPSIEREPVNEGHLLVINPADVHIGKLADSFEVGEDYNNQIAVQRVREGVKGILQKAHGFNIDRILFVIGNDILHIDTPKRTTTSGTSQDTTGMWYSNFLIAKRLYIEVIEMLMQVADVHVQYDPSNHDYTNGFFLADTISSWFSRCENVTFNVSIAHRKYFTYGKNLIGTCHGDGGRVENLPLTMAHEAAEHWGHCKHRYWYTGHLHHKVSKDFMGVCVETLRSPSGTDSWHSRNQYHYAPAAVEGFVHHKEFGQVARFTHLF